jgi:hypothetical protein
MTTRSYSDLQTLGRCPQKYKYRNVWKIQRVRKDKSLTQGSMIHRLLMAYFLGLRDGTDPETMISLEEESLREEGTQWLFQDEAVVFGDLLDDSLRIVVDYVNHYDDDWEVLHVEEQFTVEIEHDGQTYVITVTPDLVVRDRNGYVWIIDHKSTVSLPTGLPFLDLQAGVYLLAVKAVYPETKGFLFNWLRKKVPTEPRLNKTKTDGMYKVNNLKSVDTTFELLRDFITSEAPHLMDDPEHKARLAELHEENRFFSRQQIYLGAEEAQATLTDLGNQVELSVILEERGLYFRVYQSSGFMACDNCEYRSVCMTEWHGGDVDRVLSEEYEPKDYAYKEYEVE